MNEIEWSIDLGRGNDDISVGGDGGNNYFDLGTEGINPNASGGMLIELGPDADIELRGVDATHMTMLQDADEVDAAGNAAVGGAYRRPLSVDAGDGDDEITGGTAGDELSGFGGDDDIDGHEGDDVLLGGDNDDVIGVAAAGFPDGGDDLTLGGSGADLTQGGGDGFDTVSYADHSNSVIADIGDTDAGNASDGAGDQIPIAGLEKLVGTDDPDDGDVLGAAAIADNVFDGGAGPDEIDGGDGEDIVTYAGRTEVIEVALAAPVDQGGASDQAGDEYTSIEGAIGGSANDTSRCPFSAGSRRHSTAAPATIWCADGIKTIC